MKTTWWIIKSIQIAGGVIAIVKGFGFLFVFWVCLLVVFFFVLVFLGSF